MLLFQQLDGVTEADAFGAHHPVDYAFAFPARAETVPEIFLRADDERRRAVFVEGAQSDEVRAVPFQFYAAHFGQTFERDFALEPLDLALRDSRHRFSFPSRFKISVKAVFAVFCPVQAVACCTATYCVKGFLAKERFPHVPVHSAHAEKIQIEADASELR